MSRRYEYSMEDVEALRKCAELGVVDRECVEIVECVARHGGVQECASAEGIPRSTLYKRLRACSTDIDKCLEKRELLVESQQPPQPQPVEQREPRREEKPRSRVDPTRMLESAALRKLGLTAAKEAEKLVAQFLELGMLVYYRFKEFKETLGITWYELVEELYKCYVKCGIEGGEELTEEDIVRLLLEAV